VCDVPLSERIKNEMKKGGDCIDVFCAPSVCTAQWQRASAAALSQTKVVRVQQDGSIYLSAGEAIKGYRITQKTNLSISITRVLINCDHPDAPHPDNLFF
jgi:hypothetical protein